MLNRMLSELRYRLRMLLARDSVDREIDDELRFHLDRETEKYLRAGMSADDAKRRAMLALGGLNRTKDDTRDAHGTVLLDQFFQDLRYSLRGLRARPAFTAAVVITLGLGVGVNTAMFGIIDRAMLRAPRYLRDPASVNRVFVEWTAPDGSRGPERALAYTRYTDFARLSRSTSEVGGFGYRELAVGDGDNARDLPVGVFSASYVGLFDAKPVIGRWFTADEDRPPAGEPVAVLGYSYWKSQYASRRDVIGSTIHVGNVMYRIIGVAPGGFEGMTDDAKPPVVFIPITSFASRNRSFYTTYNWSWMQVAVRRRPGVDVASASADLTAAFRASWNAERELTPSLSSADAVKPEAIAAPIQMARGPLAGPQAKVMLWITGVAAVVLLIACANVANLLLVHALRRRREIAVRRALGGSRARLVAQLLTESLTLSFFGGIAGVLGAQLASGALQRILAPDLEAVSVIADSRTLAFALLTTIVTAVLAGAMPALHAGSDDLAGSLRGGMRGMANRASRTRHALLIFQTALSAALLIGAGLFVRSAVAAQATRLGYDVDPIIYVGANLRGTKLTNAEQIQLADNLVQQARTMPGVENATLTISVPFWSFEGRGLRVPGVDSVRKLGQFLLQAGSTDFFSTVGTRILRGRGFSADDRANAPYVAVVSEAMAKVLWPGQDPIGKQFKVGPDSAPFTTVVGVAENIHAEQLTNDAEFAYYLPIEQYRAEFGGGLPYLYVRVNGRGSDFAEAVRARLQRVMPGASYITTEPFRELVEPTMRSWTSGATMFTSLGLLALSLAAIGLYAVIAFGVAQRFNEIGVRVALGALPGDVVRLIIGEGVRVTLAGLILGVGMAYLSANGIAGLLFKESPRDPVVYVVVMLTLIVVGVLASVIPASRAARLDPNVALRAE
jgi:predicted permease